MLKNTLIVIFVLMSTITQADECSYMPKQTKENPDSGLSPQGQCGELIGQDEFKIYPKHLKELFFKNGLAEIFVDDKVFYVSESGKAVSVHMFDNGADYFVEGLARTISNKKFGFIDKGLNVVIKPEYDFAFPFENSMAVVCNGCGPKEDGGHQLIFGGKWGVIDKSGNIVIPVKYVREELEKNADYLHLKRKRAE